MAMMMSQQANPLSAGPEQGQAQGPGPDFASSFASMHSQLESTRTQFQKLVNYQITLKKTSAGLDELVELGDTVELDDVVRVAGELVSHGLDPASMAGILADAPQKGEALAGWIAQQAMNVTQKIIQLGPVLKQHQHQLGIEALQVLALDSALT